MNAVSLNAVLGVLVFAASILSVVAAVFLLARFRLWMHAWLARTLGMPNPKSKIQNLK